MVEKPRVRVKAVSGAQLRMDANLGSPNAPRAPATAYNAASMAPRMAGWTPSWWGPNAVVANSGPAMVRRSRDLRRNNPVARRALDLISTHAVGTGMKPRPLCTNKRVREALVRLWADWVAVADADGVLDFYGLQALAVSEMAEAGECFARMRQRRITDGLPVPLQIQLLPTEMVPLEWQGNGAGDIRQGIEYNSIGRRVAYHTYPQHPGEWTGPQTVLMEPRPIPADQVVHLFDVTNAGLQRGLPWLGAAMPILQQIAEYQDAELIRKKAVAAIVGFVRKPFTGTEDAAALAEEWGRLAQGLDPAPAVRMKPGTMQYLDPGEDVTFVTPADVGQNYEAFLRSQYRAISAGAGVLYEELTGDWSNTNDRTFRAQFNTFLRKIRYLQWSILAVQFNQPIWNRFVDYAVASGALTVPKSVSDADLKRCEWATERHPYINVKQDVEAIGAELALGLTSRQAAVAERGDDVEVLDAQIAADKAREAEMGILQPAVTQPPPQPVPDDPEA